MDVASVAAHLVDVLAYRECAGKHALCIRRLDIWRLQVRQDSNMMFNSENVKLQFTWWQLTYTITCTITCTTVLDTDNMLTWSVRSSEYASMLNWSVR